MASKEHQDRVKELVSEGASRIKFRKAVKTALMLTVEDDDPKGLVEDLHEDLGLVPDAFHIDLSERVVTVYEVEKSYKLSMTKQGRLIGAWRALDFYGWTLKTIVVDQLTGSRGIAPMVDMYLASISRHLESQRPGRGQGVVSG